MNPKTATYRQGFPNIEKAKSSFLSDLEGVNYPFGFNSKENDNEVKGAGNQQDYGFRIYDPRLGRFLSVDPLFRDFPWNSTYAFAENDVISCVDLDGLEKTKRTVPPSRTTEAFLVYDWQEIDGKYYCLNYVYNATIYQADAARKNNALNGGKGREAGQGEFAPGKRGQNKGLNWCLLRNPGLTPNGNQTKSNSVSQSFTGGYDQSNTGTANSSNYTFTYNTIPTTPILPDGAVILNTNITTTLSIQFDFDMAVADQLTLTNQTGIPLLPQPIAGTTNTPQTVQGPPLAAPNGQINANLTPAATGSIASFTLTVTSTITITYTVVDPGAINNVGPPDPPIKTRP